jgi:hypothetical protein
VREKRFNTHDMHFVGQSIVSQSLKTTNLMDGPLKNSANHL